MAKQKKQKPVPPGMVRCPECVDGWRMVDEPGCGPIKDACYHCANSGFITDEQARHDRMRGIAEGMGHRAMCAIRDARNSNPDGEDFAFCAAENMCSEYEYGLGIAADYADRMLRHFEAIDAKDRLLMDCLMDAIDPPAKAPAKADPFDDGDDFDYDGDTDPEPTVIEPPAPPTPEQRGEIAALADLLTDPTPPPKREYTDDDIPF